ncbi:hydroxyacylglutathione hydrolase [Thalassococcus sp. CAU 1522]|uniref:Hydroxyacylglutathione hydrolase n=1 Tax=Thalassococcus arenae TaxID=2851652 RepID=A0ABS6N504_9RHOB|nr:hydroxyacylglutathione hydrolase [Thalassococcus arenae]MBV2359084.1 hydroxyacylglutathione hydrolase [Thalassococcus arenae]
MPLDIVTVPCLSDNYAYLVNGPDGVAVIDAPEAVPIIAALDARGWTPGVILLTHHHGDHVQGVDEIKARYGCAVMGPEAEKAKLPPLDAALPDGMSGGSGDGAMTVIAVPGHTLGHVAYHYPAAKAVFTADSLMAGGCGRVFEGTPEMMWDSLSKLAALPPDTMVYSGHEYTASNLRFALTIEPDNAALRARADDVARANAQGRPTAQAPLSLELDTNPFLRARLPQVKAAIGMADASDARAFAEIRARKDRF